MLFNSLEFFIFLPTVFFLYWFVFEKNLKAQNALVLISSYVFYGWWDWRFLALIASSTIVDYVIGISIYATNNKKNKKLLLWFSIVFNLGLLGFFKYYNFFIDSWIDLVSILGYQMQSTWTLKVILPVGISFYTFQTMSYSLDIYFKKLKPTNDFISFASFVSFFPQLVAGPIERASNLLPQILINRKFFYNQGVQGLRLIIWGMFKKVAIADSLGLRVDYIFENYTVFNGPVLILGLLYFSFQIYCDFSGYSDIARGTAKLFGFEIMSNFKFPYFSRNIGEFWRRWHISLSTWFRDYLYIPLGGSRKGRWLSLRNIFTIFIISGFWHGANWTFIIWGLIHSLFYIPLFLFGNNKRYTTNIVAYDKLFPSIIEVFQMGITFLSVMIAWVFFRSETVLDSINYLKYMISNEGANSSDFFYFGIFYVLVILILDWLYKTIEYSNIINNRFVLYLIIFLLLIMTNFSREINFIYFQF